MSLRDQLLKAGLVTQEQAKRVESEARKNTHTVKKNKKLGAAEKAKKKAEQAQREQELAAKREHDRQLNLAREAKLSKKEKVGRARQIIANNRLNNADAADYFNFQVGRYVRRVRVTPLQLNQLAMGKLGIARNPQDVFDFPIVSRENALKLQALNEANVLLLHSEIDSLEDDDWPQGY